MKRIKIKNIQKDFIGKHIKVCGWIRSVRDQKNFAFIELNDGTQLNNLQIILDESLLSYIPQITTGTSISVEGILVESLGEKQAFELKAEKIEIYGACPADEYPLQKKRHSFEFLRTIGHLRPRTNIQGAVSRVRSALVFATHQFFQEQDFIYVTTPIITAADTEGAGEQFTVTSFNFKKLPILADAMIDFSKDFFGKQTYLTVSGQLNAEALACALGDVYTFGPTFRAENSHTYRHLAEFWMLEPEIAFCDLQGNMECAQQYVKAMISHLLKHCIQDMELFDRFIEKGLIERLKNVLNNDFAKLTYTEAIGILQKSGKSFEFPVKWGIDLQSEHERFLAEHYCKKPVFITDYPEKIKAFYMRANEDGKTVAAMDLLVPKIGELIGGSQREERCAVLEKKIIDFGLNLEDYWWFLQLRKYGTIPHAGFGVGFERFLLFATGMENIRDVIAFPRFSGYAEF